MTFKKRRIDVTIKLSNGTFSDTGTETVTLTGHRVQANIAASALDAQGVLQMRIYGLKLGTMNQLTRIGTIGNKFPQNAILVAAGDDQDALSLAYKGTIAQAWADFNSAPEVALNITAFSAYDAALNPVGAKSYKGEVDAAQVMKDIAVDMRVPLINHGVSVPLSNPYFYGSALAQADECARMAGFRYAAEDGNLVIWPERGARRGDIALISPGTGMVGYPMFSAEGIVLNTLYLPHVRCGQQVDVESSLTVACGTWNVRGLIHTLEANKPDGAWFSQLACGRPIDG